MLRGDVLLTLLGCVAACARLPPSVSPGMGTLWGYVRLVPREGVTPGRAADYEAYADRRLRDVTFVDYRHPGFVVVYLAGDAPGGASRITIEASLGGPRFAPAHAVVGVGGRVVVRNRDVVAHVLSAPAAHVLRSLAPEEEVAIPATDAGPLAVFLLDAPGTDGLVFVAPGPYATADDEGRFELPALSPGRHTLRAWHPRFPGATREVDVPAGRAERIDLAIGVGNLHDD